jgi:hypothetical protein
MKTVDKSKKENGTGMARKRDEIEDKNGLKIRPRTKKESTKKRLVKTANLPTEKRRIY